MKTYMYMLHKTEQKNLIIYKESSVWFCSHHDPLISLFVGSGVLLFWYPQERWRRDSLTLALLTAMAVPPIRDSEGTGRTFVRASI